MMKSFDFDGARKALAAITAMTALALLTACDDAALEELTGPPGFDKTAQSAPAPQVQAPRGKAVLYFYRPKTLAGSANTFRVSVDGVAVAQMAVGTVHAETIAPGEHVITVKETATLLNAGLALALQKKPQLPIRMAPGQTAHVRVDASQWSGGPVLSRVDGATASAAVGGFRAAAPL